MIAKFEIIYKELLKNDYVLYIDGDIVIKKRHNKIFIFCKKELRYYFPK